MASWEINFPEHARKRRRVVGKPPTLRPAAERAPQVTIRPALRSLCCQPSGLLCVVCCRDSHLKETSDEAADYVSSSTRHPCSDRLRCGPCSRLLLPSARRRGGTGARFRRTPVGFETPANLNRWPDRWSAAICFVSTGVCPIWNHGLRDATNLWKKTVDPKLRS